MTDFTIGIHTDGGITTVEAEGDMTDTVPTFTDDVEMFRVIEYADGDGGETIIKFECTTRDFAYCNREGNGYDLGAMDD